MSDSREVWPLLNARERAFVEYVAIGKSYAYAARRAGYASKNSARQGSEMAQRPHLRAAIDRRRRELAEEVGLSAGGVLHELALIAHSDLGWFGCDPATGEITLKAGAPKGARRALAKIKRTITHRTIGKDDDAERVTTITAEFALWDKPTALLKAGQHTGAFDDERLDVEATRDLLAAIATIVQRRLEAALSPAVSGPLLAQLGADLYAHVSAQYPQVALAAHTAGGDAVDAPDLADGAA
jgi:hypothetical protein